MLSQLFALFVALGVGLQIGERAKVFRRSKQTSARDKHQIRIIVQGCSQRWNEEKEKMDAAQAGLNELEAQTVARVEGLSQVLKDRQSTVLAALTHEREVGRVRSGCWSDARVGAWGHCNDVPSAASVRHVNEFREAPGQPNDGAVIDGRRQRQGRTVRATRVKSVPGIVP